jgi:transcriptional regulator with XRE-family HTH domain
MAKADETKRQRLAFEFFGDHFREDKPFTQADLAAKTGWSPKTASTYLSKHFEPFIKPVPPIRKGQQQKHQAFRVTDVLLMIGKWTKFRRHVSQKRKLTYQYDRSVYQTVLMFEFFLPLTNETVLRNELDALIFKNTIQKKLLTIGLVELKSQIGPSPEESDKDYLDRVVTWFGQQVRGYSVSHVNGRFRGEDVVLSDPLDRLVNNSPNEILGTSLQVLKRQSYRTPGGNGHRGVRSDWVIVTSRPY